MLLWECSQFVVAQPLVTETFKGAWQLLLQHNQVKVEFVVGPFIRALDKLPSEGQSVPGAASTSLVEISPTIPPHNPPNAPVLLEPRVIQKTDWLTLVH